MKLKIDKKPLYACDKCCTHLHNLGEPCHRCHNGKGEQVYPLPEVTKEETRERKRKTAMTQGVSRLQRRSHAVSDDRMQNYRSFGVGNGTVKVKQTRRK